MLKTLLAKTFKVFFAIFIDIYDSILISEEIALILYKIYVFTILLIKFVYQLKLKI